MDSDLTLAVEVLYEDVTACFLALAHALDAKGVLKKSEFAAAARERIVYMRAPGQPVETPPPAMLLLLATELERLEAD